MFLPINSFKIGNDQSFLKEKISFKYDSMSYFLSFMLESDLLVVPNIFVPGNDGN